MTVHLYLSFIPEALIASMLPPDQFGEYFAVGSTKKKRGQAMFAELDPDFRHAYFRIEEGLARCVPHEDGTPKKSVFVSSYRVLEHVPMGALRQFYLTTAYGQVLGLERSKNIDAGAEKLHLYQELAPIHPLVVSTLDPVKFNHLITHDPGSLIHLPAFCFVELRLGQLAADPEYGAIEDLPYGYMPHLRECLIEVQDKALHTKMVNRIQPVEFPYRTIKNGIFLGNQEALAYFPMPSREALRDTYYRWWRSANL
jgi:hypothetical protein